MANQRTLDEFLQDGGDQNLAAAVADLKTLVQNIASEVQSLKTSSQTQDKTLATDKHFEQIRDDIGSAEALSANVALAAAKQAARDYDNSKMNQADEKDFALTTKFDNIKYGKQIVDHSDKYFNQLLGQRDQLFAAFINHYTSEMSNERVAKAYALSDERVQKDALRSPEIQGGKAIGDE